MRKYMKRRYHSRRNAAIEFLGGKCVVCGTTEKLEFDHIDPKKKKYAILEMRGLGDAKFWDEIKKCQLLCEEHHRWKSVDDMGHEHATHGSLTMYSHHKCRCELCRKANWDYIRARREKKDGRKILPRSKEIKHGTPSAYGYRKCRCDICRAGNASRAREYNRKKINLAGAQV